MKKQNLRNRKGFLGKDLERVSELVERKKEEDIPEKGKTFKKCLKKSAIVTIVIIAMITIAYVGNFYIPVIKAYCTNEKTICRNLNNIFYLWEMDEKPEGRNAAWDSEIPGFVKADLQYADKYDLEISYDYYGAKMSVSFDSEGRPNIIAYGPRTGILTYDLTNFSMYYRSSKKTIEIYGTNSDEGFESFSISDDYDDGIAFSVRTYNPNIPFDVDVPRYECVNVAEYTYIVDLKDDGKCSILWYKDGVLEETTVFPELVEKYDLEKGVFITKENDIYTSFVEMDDQGNPNMIFSYVDKIDTNGYVEKTLSGASVKLPLLVKNNEYYTLLPEDWDTYCAYASASSEKLQEDVKSPNYNVSLVKLEDNFISAEFSLGGAYHTRWYAKIQFDIGGIIIQLSYRVNGYDNIEVSEEDEKSLTKKVTSTEEFWKHIKKIRKTYEKYYDFPNF